MAGVIMIILPGPALVVIPLGLLVLASEFLIIRRWIRTARKSFLSRNKTRGGTFSPLADTTNN